VQTTKPCEKIDKENEGYQKTVGLGEVIDMINNVHHYPQRYEKCICVFMVQWGDGPDARFIWQRHT